MPDSETQRLFVAIPLPADIRASIASVHMGLRGARWVEAEKLHLTLRFLGDVATEQVEPVCQALSRIDSPPLTIAIEGMGSFGSRREPRVVFANVTPSPYLLRLQTAIETAVVGVGLQAEDRPYRPHITLARLRGAHVSEVRRFIAEHHLEASFKADEFCLYRSELRGDGARHSVIQRQPLR